jgi:exosortase/archaeosortase family protein
VGAFGVLRAPIVEARILTPLTSFQGTIAAWHTGGSAPMPVAVTLACSGADVIALCLAVTLAYPVAWRRRVAGAALGLVSILGLNTVRIGSLAALSSTPYFDLAHVYFWPALLTVATLAYVAAWMWMADGHASWGGVEFGDPRLRFAAFAVVLVVAFAAAAPWMMESAAVLALARVAAASAAALLEGAGLTATHTNRLLTTPYGSFFVTGECVTTPLMPLYVAGVLAAPLSRSRRLAALLAFVPVFAILTTLRLLTLAVPPAVVRSPLFLTHGFHQIVLAVGLVCLAAVLARRPDVPGRLRHAGAGIVAGALIVALAGDAYTQVLLAAAGQVARVAPWMLTTLAAASDDQGALAILPALQVALFGSLWIAAVGLTRLRRFGVGFGILAATQMALLGAAGLLGLAGLGLPVVATRAWALAVPAALLWLLAPHACTGPQVRGLRFAALSRRPPSPAV